MSRPMTSAVRLLGAVGKPAVDNNEDLVAREIMIFQNVSNKMTVYPAVVCMRLGMRVLSLLEN